MQSLYAPDGGLWEHKYGAQREENIDLKRQVHDLQDALKR